MIYNNNMAPGSSKDLNDVCVYQYTDFRKYLEDVYIHRKAARKSFSHRFIASRVGFKSPGHFSQVIKGKLNISIGFIEQFSKLLGHNKRESSYFLNLVLYNQAKDEEEKERYLLRMMEFKESVFRQVAADEYQFYHRWYYTAIRELIGIWDFKGDYKALAKQLAPPIRVSDAKEAVELLERLNMIRREEGRYVICEQFLTTGINKRSFSISKYVNETLQLASESLIAFPKGEKNLSWVALSVSDESYSKVVDEIRDFRRRILKIAEMESNPNRICHLNLNLFPITRRIVNEVSK